MKISNKLSALLLVITSAFALGLIGIAGAATVVNLGTANTFAVLAGSGITNTGTTTITGDIGTFATTTITGAPIVIGTNHAGDSVTQLAKTDLVTAYDAAAGQSCNTDLTGQDLGGLTLTPGVYCYSTSAQLTGTLTLNGGGDPNAVFIFKIGSTLTTASSSSISLINSAQSRNVFWQVGSSATLGTTTSFKGNILALTSITLTTGATVQGRMLARNGAVTLDSNSITIPTGLHLRKTVTNDNGGTALNTAWTLTATGTGGSPTNLSGTTPVDSGASLKADTYTLAESGGPAGYTANPYSCVINGGGAAISNSITLAPGDEATCTITNDDVAPQLYLRKLITNDNGGAATAADFTLTANGTGINDITGTSPVNSTPGLLADTFALSETGLSGYTASAWVCVGGTQVGSNITVAINQSATCTITNDDIAPALHLRKTVINNNSGAAVDTAWTLTATGTGGSPTNLSGTTPVDSGASLKADTYTLAESGGPVGYTASAWVCVGGTQVGSTIAVALGGSATCTITNDDVAPGVTTLTVTKTVINTNGGTKIVSQFPLFIDGGSVTSGVSNVTTAGLHTVSETPDSGYVGTIGGDCAADGTITLVLGTNKTCTITNDDIDPGTATINVTKVVVNDNGGTKVIADFPLFVNGTSVVSGVTNTFSAPATYTVTEASDARYTQAFSGDCDVHGVIHPISGDIKVCFITNNDILQASGGIGVPPPVPPLIDVVKVPSPLALPNGPGPVTYTYTLRNIGVVPVTDITMTGDSCSPIALISGDTNTDSKLDVNETWIYRCTTTLTQTHTNTVTATGWANGISAVDVASATVVVGVPVAPPLIHVTKIPNPLALSTAGIITYTNKVTNPGVTALNNIKLIDDKCSPVKYLSGDTNHDSKLDMTETWIYTCSSHLTETTTNTVMATGEANNLTARDFAVATVVVAPIVPKLPNTGLPPDMYNQKKARVIVSGLLILFGLVSVCCCRLA